MVGVCANGMEPRGFLAVDSGVLVAVRRRWQVGVVSWRSELLLDTLAGQNGRRRREVDGDEER